jgi:hypothetical protein
MSKATNIQSKSILARLLADEDLSVRHDMAAPTAAFDLQTRTLILPVWENMSASLYDMLVGHEVAHALYTPSDRWQNDIQSIATDYGLPYGTVQQYVNIVEDARIERAIKAKFPGLRRDFLSAYVDLMGRDLFDLKGRSIADLPLIDRINLEFKVGLHAGQQIPFDAAESVWVDRVSKAGSWEDVLDIVTDMLREIIGNGENTESDSSSDTESSDGDEQNTQPQGGEGDKGESDEDSGQGSGSAADEGEEPAADSSSDSDSDGGQDEAQSQTASQSVPESITDDAFGKVVDHLRVDNPSSYTHDDMDLPEIDMNAVLIDWQQIHRELNKAWLGDANKGRCDVRAREFIAHSKPVVNVLVKAFEMRKSADAARRVQIHKSGVLDTVKMMNYKWSEDIFRRTSTVRDGKNHGLVMFLDWSGSMADSLIETIEQLIQLSMFCRKVNIPFEVYAFSSMAPALFGKGSSSYKNTNDNHNHYPNFTLLNFLSSKMNRQQFDAALLNVYALAMANDYDSDIRLYGSGNFGLGSTPLNEALLAAMTIVPEFQKANRIQVVNTVFLTDGAGNGWLIPRQGTVRFPGDRLPIRVDGRSATRLFADVLRDRTGSNIVNFFLANWQPARFERMAWSYFRDDKKIAAAAETWRKDNYAIGDRDDDGWDEQYLIRTRRVENTDISLIDDKASSTKKKNAFLKSLGAKMTSRVVLNRFIDMIA